MYRYTRIYIPTQVHKLRSIYMHITNLSLHVQISIYL